MLIELNIIVNTFIYALKLDPFPQICEAFRALLSVNCMNKI